jgi:Icc-related predicted phosphoesterase
MKLRLVSDLHLEALGVHPPPRLEYLGEDVLVLAGDIISSALITGPSYDRFVEWLYALTQYRDVIYIPGNHEYYGSDPYLTDKWMTELAAEAHVGLYVPPPAKEKPQGGIGVYRCTKGPQEYAIFYGTLWSEIGTSPDLRSRIADYTYIHNGGGEVITPDDTRDTHRKSVRKLVELLAKEPESTRKIVATHHAPSKRSVSARYTHNPLNSAYYTNLEAVMTEYRVALWVHGHMHNSSDYAVDGSRVVCNPAGYPDSAGQPSNPEFDSQCIINIKAINKDVS